MHLHSAGSVTPVDPQVSELAERLGLHPVHARVIASSLRMWRYWRDLKDGGGPVPPLNAKTISLAVGWRGEPEAFVAVLVDVGLLDPSALASH